LVVEKETTKKYSSTTTRKKRRGDSNLKRNQKRLRAHNKEVEKSIKRLKRYQINKEVMKPRTHKEALKSTTSAQQGNIEDH
jgi:hypothetical protein